MHQTTCPLDCFDGCCIVVGDDKSLKGNKEHPITKGFLCHHLNHYHSFERIQQPSLNNQPIFLEEALATLIQKLENTDAAKTLYFKGSGNLGVMQSVTKPFFAKRGAILASGSLCDEAGDVGATQGRGANLCLSPLHVNQSEVVILWGRNPSVTNSHMLPSLKGKTLIVIDPIKIDLAQNAALHIQIKPRADIYLAMLLARVAYMEQMEDTEFIEKRCTNFKYFIDFINGIPMRTLMDKCGTSLDDVGKLLALIAGKKVSILVGIGVQKYSFGHSVLRSIDSFAALLGLFGKEGCGVGYLSNSGFGFTIPFKVKAKTEVMPTVDFGKFELVFIQGGNPMEQMPCTPRVKDGLEKAKFVVYFGLHENETSKMANLVIPSKSFFEKDDLKLSYGHEFIGKMPKAYESDFGISEYDLCAKLMQHFNFEKLQSEQEIIDSVIDSNSLKKDGFLISKTYEHIPYEKEFYTKSGKFEFFDEFDDEFDDTQEGFYLLAAKQNKSLNSQFIKDDYLYVPLHVGLNKDDKVMLSNQYGECVYTVCPSDKLRDDCVMLYSGAKNANMLTPHKASQEGDCAIYQEVKVRMEKI
ncbi:MAG: molybdopterin-dependent oxidoreductase [Campylobacteraceae bacterium]|nr:molybdopterin-dependent oxidoreductase [Campylobacteraceae bacterium]